MGWSLFWIITLFIWTVSALAALPDQPHFPKIAWWHIAVLIVGFVFSYGFFLTLRGRNMDWGQVASIAVIIQTILIAVSVFFVWHEIRISNKLRRAANSEKLIEMSFPINLLLLQDSELATLWEDGKSRFENMGEIEQRRYKRLMMIWLNFEENVFHQNAEGLLDEQTFSVWSTVLGISVRDRLHPTLWNSEKINFAQSFRNHVDKLLADIPSKNINYTSTS